MTIWSVSSNFRLIQFTQDSTEYSFKLSHDRWGLELSGSSPLQDVMPAVQADSHRGRVCQALSSNNWMDCHDVADTIGYSVDGASKVLGDVFRAGYVNRRETTDRENVDYEYQLKENVRVR